MKNSWWNIRGECPLVCLFIRLVLTFFFQLNKESHYLEIFRQISTVSTHGSAALQVAILHEFYPFFQESRVLDFYLVVFDCTAVVCGADEEWRCGHPSLLQSLAAPPTPKTSRKDLCAVSYKALFRDPSVTHQKNQKEPMKISWWNIWAECRLIYWFIWTQWYHTLLQTLPYETERQSVFW